jgi:ABC-type lipoprotein export system ATPase subunit
MLEYLHYIWSLLSHDEKRKFVRHISSCAVSGILYNVMDWQYLIILTLLSSYDSTQITKIILFVQLIIWVANLGYYYLKSSILTNQSKFYSILSTRHYNYILRRIEKCAPTEWIVSESPTTLTRLLEVTEKGLFTICTFATQSAKLFFILAISLLVICYNYMVCIPVFLVFGVVVYYILRNDTLFQTKSALFISTQQSAKIIEDNIAVLSDGIINDDTENIIRNISTFNNYSKKIQSEVFAKENKVYVKVGFSLVTIYGVMLCVMLITSGFMIDNMMLFLVACLLCYKCLSYCINEFCDLWAGFRQVCVEFDQLKPLWEITSKKRPAYTNYEFHDLSMSYDLVKKFNDFKFDQNDALTLKQYEKYIESTEPKTFQDFSKKFKYPIHLIYEKHIDDGKKYVCASEFIFGHTFRSQKYMEQEDKIDKNLEGMFVEFHNELTKPEHEYDIIIKKLDFEHICNKTKERFKLLKPTKYDKIVIQCPSHILIDGLSGSGKSTLMKLFRGILTYRDDQLQLEFKKGDEVVDWGKIEHLISYSRQHNCNFVQGTIYQIMTGDYITKRRHKISRDKTKEVEMINYALDVAEVDVSLRDLTKVISNTTISGGQQQRLTVAKTLYRIFIQNRPIIMLDEIDTGLDSNTAVALVQKLRLLFHDRTLFIVTHNDMVKQLFPKQILIKNGNIFPSFC